MVVILGDIVPHHHTPALGSHTAHLSQRNASVGRAKESCVWEELACLVGTCHILVATDQPPTSVVVGVVADGVASSFNLINQFGVPVLLLEITV